MAGNTSRSRQAVRCSRSRCRKTRGGADRSKMQDVLEVGVDALRPGRYQPRLQLGRRRGRGDGRARLAESSREQGVLQRLIVGALPAAEADANTYEIVAGERRW